MSDIAVLVPVGLLVGTVMGLLGAGGSILTVPALLYLVGQDAHAATTTSLLVVGISAAAGVVPHHRAGRVRLRDGAAFAVTGVAGSAAGSLLTRGLDEQILVGGFAVLIAAAAVVMLLRRNAGTPTPGRGRAATWQVLATGLVVGLVTGVFGVGGGFVVVPALVLVLGYSMPDAIGTSLVIIVVNAVSALATRLAVTDVPWGVALPFAGATVFAVLVSSTFADRVPSEKLTTAFALMLFVVAGVTGYGAI